ncbi:MAG: aminomethyl-transferring glycine dehydrogenase subunit GcvPB [Promethearchaeota archaeon]
MKTIFDLHAEKRNSMNFEIEASLTGIPVDIPREMLRGGADALDLPDVPEVELVRHFIKLSKKNYGVDDGIYPLGSCTMKYNPKINEVLANLEGFRDIHPLQFLQDDNNVQGIIGLLYETGMMLSDLTGMDHFTLQPAAGAHGEFTGLLIIKKYLQDREKDGHRNKIIVSDTAHGTNPASANACDFETIELTSKSNGLVDLEQLSFALEKGDVAGIMLTNPNTLGLFEEEIIEITGMVHDAGGLCYYDGANLNGLCGVCRPGDMGFDIIHLNLHKSFSTPHGGGGPGSGPVGVKEFLKEFVPGPRYSKESGRYSITPGHDNIAGTIKAFHGNVGVIIKAYCYLKSLGLNGIRKSTQCAVLNANYLKVKLKDLVNIPHDKRCYHEFVASDVGFPNGVNTEDIAKRMLDHGIHAPTIYFPLIVHGAIMVEPTETESLDRLDELVGIFKKIKEEALSTPHMVKNAPSTLPVKRLNQVDAARNPILTIDALKEKLG